MSDNTDNVTRRSVLRKTGATGVAGLAALTATSGTAAAEITPPSGLETEQLLSEHATELFDTLKEAGIAADVDQLPTETRSSMGTVTANGEGRAAVSGIQGTREVRIGTTVDDGHLTVVVRPDEQRAYATLSQDDTTFIIDADSGFQDVSTQSDDCGCENIDCNGLRTYVCCLENGCTSECGC